jgi:hypothetical protein
MSLAVMSDPVKRARRYDFREAPHMMAYLTRVAPGVTAGLASLGPDEISLLRSKYNVERLVLGVLEVRQSLREKGGLDRLLTSDLSGLTTPPGLYCRDFPALVLAYLKWLALCEAVDSVSSQMQRENQEREVERRRVKEEQRRQDEERERAETQKRREEERRHQANLKLKGMVTSGEGLAGCDLEAEQTLDTEVVEITGVTPGEIESHRLTPEDTDALKLFTDAAMRCRGLEPEDWSETDKALILQLREKGTAINRAFRKLSWFRDLKTLAWQRQMRHEEPYDSWREYGKELK